MFHKSFIFNKSLKNNICLSSTNIDENKIKKSIKISNLEEVILKLIMEFLNLESG